MIAVSQVRTNEWKTSCVAMSSSEKASGRRISPSSDRGRTRRASVLIVGSMELIRGSKDTS